MPLSKIKRFTWIPYWNSSYLLAEKDGWKFVGSSNFASDGGERVDFYVNKKIYKAAAVWGDSNRDRYTFKPRGINLQADNAWAVWCCSIKYGEFRAKHLAWRLEHNTRK